MKNEVILSTAQLTPAASATAELETLHDSPKHATMIGAGVAFFFFVVLVGWAAVARLDSAAYGEGQVSVSGNRQTVQHRDGGIVQQLDVRDGAHVKAGQILIRLAGAEVVATERALAASAIDLQAQRARLEAEVRGTPIKWPDEFTKATGDDKVLVDRAITLQMAQLNARNSSAASNRSVLAQQEAEVSKQVGGFTAQSRASSQQRESLQQQLESTRKLADGGYVSRNSVRSIERAIQQLEGADADYSSRAAAAREQISATRAQMLQVSRKHVEDSAATLRDTQFQLNELMPKWLVAKDQVARTVIRAPVSGRVVGLKVFSVGGVVTAGQPIMDIVPDAAPLVVKANFQPSDIDGVFAGRPAEVKFLSMHERDLPILMGNITTVSADSLHDEQSGRNFFSAEVVVPKEQIALLKAVRGADLGLRPGVPVQVLVKLRKRTALQYFLDPLMETFSHSLHEQ